MEDLKKLEQKWQKRWKESKIFEPKVDRKKKKFYAHFTYPYVNAYAHLGHFYTLMKAEVMARFKRHQGYNVLLPQGWHATGSPLISAAQRVKEREEKQIKILKDMGVPESELSKFEDPAYWITFFKPKFKEDFLHMGISTDWRREYFTTSLNPHYDKFIRWQFTKLKEKEYVVKGKFPVVWCQKENNPVGDHDRIEGEGETPQEFTLLKFKWNDAFLVAATLRPETVFGQTNVWVDAEGEYVKAQVNEEVWIMSRQCAEKLKEQEKKCAILSSIKGSELLGKMIVEQFTKKELVVLPSLFCDPEKGTGIVTSVPSDAPDDYVGLRDIQEDAAVCKQYKLDQDMVRKIKPIPIIISGNLGELPAVTVVQRMGIKNQKERKKLDAAKKEVYARGFYEGVMNKSCGKFAGMKVEDAKEAIKKEMRAKGVADVLYELSGKVVCRCLTPSIVKIVADQWFIAYGNPEWKKKAHQALKKLKIFPESFRQQFTYTIDWLRDWACTREHGLGTQLPWDEKWLIESLSDSTIYLAFDTIAHLVQKGDPKKINDAAFDYIFLGKGKKPAIKDIEKMREEFSYWYPFDFNVSGKDLVQNHLTFALFNHAGVFPERYWPAGYGLNGWVMVNGEKMSKSKGNFLLMRDVGMRYGADASRLSVVMAGEGADDANWSTSLPETVGKRIEAWYEMCMKYYNKGVKEKHIIDVWVEWKIAEGVKQVSALMEQAMFRSALSVAFYDVQKVMQWYVRRTNGHPNKRVMNELIETQVVLLAPFIPHICEELWEKMGKKICVSLAAWPKAKRVVYKGNEDVISNVLMDMRKVMQLVKFTPKRVFMYVMPQEKKDVEDAKSFLENEIGLEVKVYAVNEKGRYDPQEKAKKAKPGKPALFVE